VKDHESSVVAEQAVWAAEDSVVYYATHRDQPDDLYPSERWFLPEAAREARTCLDIGCAAGGFSRIMKSFNPALAYTGVDITPALIERARAAFPESRFEVGDGIHFATPPNSYDLVFSSGMLHLNSQHREIVRSAYAQTRHLLLCDFRLTFGPAVTGRCTLNFDGRSMPSDVPTLPYLVLNADELVRDLCALDPPPRSLTIRGYAHKPTATADVPLPSVLMAFARIEKGRAGETTAVTIDLPR
jgi:SAM-dependent methyltransferase